VRLRRMKVANNNRLMPHGNRAFSTLDNDDVLPSANLPNAQGSRHRSISSGSRNISKRALTRAGPTFWSRDVLNSVL
jgi:hypothetical protein